MADGAPASLDAVSVRVRCGPCRGRCAAQRALSEAEGEDRNLRRQIYDIRWYFVTTAQIILFEKKAGKSCYWCMSPVA
eukprot:4114902-Prymnesium_polylepis.1